MSKKKKRIAATIGLLFISLFYLATLIFAFIDSPFAQNWLMTALFATIVIPAVLYGYIIFTESHHHKYEDQIAIQDEESSS